VSPRHETLLHYFLCSGGAIAVSKKKHIDIGYVRFVFLHILGSTGHLVHSGASGV
jgi:hypothetical protein